MWSQDVDTFHISRKKSTTAGFVMDAEHAHTYHEILFNFSAIPICHTSNGYEHQTDTPCIIYRAPNILHSTNTLTDQLYTRYVVCFAPSVLEEYDGICSLGRLADRWECTIPTTVECMEHLDQLLSRLQQLWVTDMPRFYWVSILAALLHEVNELVPTQFPDEKQIPPYIKQLMEYISDHLGDDLTLETLAKQFFISRSKLIDDFYSATHIRLREYIASIRLGRAKNMIAQGLPLSIVAERCGYSQAASFLHMF